MSEHINNREYRQKKLKELIKRLHEGASVKEVQEEFKEITVGVTATEITEMEQSLVDEGMPVIEIQRLCDVHASVFKGSIEDIHKDKKISTPEFEEGHPVHTFKLENRAIETLIDDEIGKLLATYKEDRNDVIQKALFNSITKLASIDTHYKRKENLLFPYMERYNITAPPQVMWGIDDEIREKLKEVTAALKEVSAPLVEEALNEVTEQIKEMIFKEDEILFPMIIEKFTQEEWVDIEKSSEEIGFTLIDSVKSWSPKMDKKEEVKVDTANATSGVIEKDSDAEVQFDAGSLTAEEINCIFNTVPFDMTFVGANGRVKYFTQGKERIFDRAITIIGREVKNCHPPKSVHIVEQIVKDLQSGKKDNEDFWIRMGDVFVYIRYFAVRNKDGEYLGTVEVSQNIKPITELEGEKRLMS